MFSGPQLPGPGVAPLGAAPAPAAPALAPAAVEALEPAALGAVLGLPAVVADEAGEPPVAGVVGIVEVGGVVGLAPIPLALAGGVVAVPAPAWPLALPLGAAVEPAVVAGVAPVAGAVETGLDVLVSPPQPASAAPATKAVDAQSTCEIFIILLPNP